MHLLQPLFHSKPTDPAGAALAAAGAGPDDVRGEAGTGEASGGDDVDVLAEEAGDRVLAYPAARLHLDVRVLFLERGGVAPDLIGRKIVQHDDVGTLLRGFHGLGKVTALHLNFARKPGKSHLSQLVSMEKSYLFFKTSKNPT